ncbi:MAG: DUF4395 domain-containing protein [Candidatus Kapabacteria bacterium]|nr:DUF4395 domain-containing protein [Candidatus Kapabacteria bacterium]
MSKIFKFGEDVEGYTIPVLNEREIRAAAGMLFVLMFIAVSQAAMRGNFVLLKYAIVIFFMDILIRVLVNPRFSPTLILGRLIVRNQTPEYVGAVQKKFAWIIGIFLVSIMFIFSVVMNTYSPITGIICMICLIFLFFESAFGICIGCKVYNLIYKGKAQHCPGEICDIKSRHEIQKTGAAHWLILIGFVLYIILVVFLFGDCFKQKSSALFGKEIHTEQR